MKERIKTIAKVMVLITIIVGSVVSAADLYRVKAEYPFSENITISEHGTPGEIGNFGFGMEWIPLVTSGGGYYSATYTGNLWWTQTTRNVYRNNTRPIWRFPYDPYYLLQADNATMYFYVHSVTDDAGLGNGYQLRLKPIDQLASDNVTWADYDGWDAEYASDTSYGLGDLAATFPTWISFPLNATGIDHINDLKGEHPSFMLIEQNYDVAINDPGWGRNEFTRIMYGGILYGNWPYMVVNNKEAEGMVEVQNSLDAGVYLVLITLALMAIGIFIKKIAFYLVIITSIVGWFFVPEFWNTWIQAVAAGLIVAYAYMTWRLKKNDAF